MKIVFLELTIFISLIYYVHVQFQLQQSNEVSTPLVKYWIMYFKYFYLNKYRKLRKSSVRRPSFQCVNNEDVNNTQQSCSHALYLLNLCDIKKWMCKPNEYELTLEKKWGKFQTVTPNFGSCHSL